MHSKHPVTISSAVISFNHNGGLIAEARDLGARGYEPGASRGVETQVFIQIMIVQADDGWL
jgi:hypothetical protein